MPRIRFTLDESRAEATRLASEYVKTQKWFNQARFKGINPSLFAHKSPSSKFPVEWRAVYVFHGPDEIVDGGELFLDVNIETKVVKARP